MASNQYKIIDIQLVNDTTSDIPARYSKTWNEAFVEKMDDWQCSVIRLECPSSSIQMFNIDNITDYRVGIYQIINNDTIGDVTDGVNQYYTSLPLSTDVPINSKDDVLEMINRALLKCWYHFCYQWYTNGGTPSTTNSWQSLNATGALTRASPSVTFTTTTRTGTVSSNYQFAYSKITFNSLIYTTPSVSSDYSSACDIYYTAPSPNTKTVLLASGIVPITNNGSNWTNLVFEDGGQHAYSVGKLIQWAEEHDGDFSLMGSMQPQESICLKFATYTSAFTGIGGYTLSVKPYHATTTITIDADMDISWAHVPTIATKGANLPPLFQYDRNTDTINLRMQESFQYYGLKLAMTDRVANMLGFAMEDATSWHNGANIAHKNIKFPDWIYSTNIDEYITIPQNIKSSYVMDKIHSIQIRSSIPIDGEYHGTNLIGQNDNRVNVLTDFIPSLNGLRDNLLYVTPSADYRLYNLIGQGGLNSIEFSIWCTFQDGSDPQLIQLKPGEIGNIKLQLRKIN